MPQFSLNELANNAGSSAANTGINLAKQAKGLACGLYKNYSGWATNLSLPTPPPAAFVKGVWDTVCADDPGGLPTPPPEPSTKKCWRFSGVDGNGSKSEIFQCGFKPEWREYIYGRPEFYSPYLDNVHASNTTSYWGVTKVSANISQVTNASFTPGFVSEGTCTNCLSAPAPSPSPNPPPIVIPPPGALTKNVTINYNDGTKFNIPLTFKQVNNNLDITVDVGGVGFNFNVDGVSFNWNQNSNSNYINLPGGGSGSGGGGAGGDSNFILNNKLDNTFNNIIDIKNDLSDVNIDIKKVADSLDCDPCEQLKEIKDILTYKPTYTSASIPNFQSVTRDNLFNLGYLEIELSKLPHSTKIIFGGDSPNAMYTGWLFWRHNEFNFEKIIIHSAKSVYHAPKWANGFAICCSHGARANVFYYTEVK